MASVDDQSVYVSGRFPGVQKEEISAYIHGMGGRSAFSKSGASMILTADPNDPKALALAATGKQIITLNDLGAPLEGYLERIKAGFAAFQAQFASYKKPMVYHFAAGPPADAALMARVEAALGFPLPSALRTLMEQLNGLSVVGAQLKEGASLELPEGVLPYAALADMSHPLWSAAKPGEAITAIAIPDWETIFLRSPAHRMTGDGSQYGPKDTLKIGSLKVKAQDLYKRLYPFDLFSDFHGAALYADPVAEDIKVIYGSDYWASMTDAHPVSLRAYMESLSGMVWHRAGHWPQRIINPTSKTAKPTYIRNIHGCAYMFLELSAR